MSDTEKLIQLLARLRRGHWEAMGEIGISTNPDDDSLENLIMDRHSKDHAAEAERLTEAMRFYERRLRKEREKSE